MKRKKRALKVFRQKKSILYDVEPEKSGVNGVEP